MITSEDLQKSFKYLFPNEVPALKILANMLPSNPTIINIGAGSGTSGLAFMESRPDVFLRTVDIQFEDSPFGCLVAEKKLIEDAGNISERYLPVCLDSKEYGDELNAHGFKVDMVFVDGDHSYDGCKGDILAWLPNIKSGGIIAIHDYKKGELFAHDEDYQPDKPHPKPWPGVDQAVDELLLGKYEQVLRIDSLVAFRVK